MGCLWLRSCAVSTLAIFALWSKKTGFVGFEFLCLIIFGWVSVEHQYPFPTPNFTYYKLFLLVKNVFSWTQQPKRGEAAVPRSCSKAEDVFLERAHTQSTHIHYTNIHIYVAGHTDCWPALTLTQHQCPHPACLSGWAGWQSTGEYIYIRTRQIPPAGRFRHSVWPVSPVPGTWMCMLLRPKAHSHCWYRPSPTDTNTEMRRTLQVPTADPHALRDRLSRTELAFTDLLMPWLPGCFTYFPANLSWTLLVITHLLTHPHLLESLAPWVHGPSSP